MNRPVGICRRGFLYRGGKYFDNQPFFLLFLHQKATCNGQIM